MTKINVPPSYNFRHGHLYLNQKVELDRLPNTNLSL